MPQTDPTGWLGGQLTSQAVPPDEHPWNSAQTYAVDLGMAGGEVIVRRGQPTRVDMGAPLREIDSAARALFRAWATAWSNAGH